jgi:hypothetical protein
MLSQSLDGRNQVTMVALDQLVPENHLVRSIEAVIDFYFINDLVEGKFSLDDKKLLKIAHFFANSRLKKNEYSLTNGKGVFGHEKGNTCIFINYRL